MIPPLSIEQPVEQAFPFRLYRLLRSGGFHRHPLSILDGMTLFELLDRRWPRKLTLALDGIRLRGDAIDLAQRQRHAVQLLY